MKQDDIMYHTLSWQHEVSQHNCDNFNADVSKFLSLNVKKKYSHTCWSTTVSDMFIPKITP